MGLFYTRVIVKALVTGSIRKVVAKLYFMAQSESTSGWTLESEDKDSKDSVISRDPSHSVTNNAKCTSVQQNFARPTTSRQHEAPKRYPPFTIEKKGLSEMPKHDPPRSRKLHGRHRLLLLLLLPANGFKPWQPRTCWPQASVRCG